MSIQLVRDQLLGELAEEMALMPGSKVLEVEYIFTIRARIQHPTEGRGTLEISRVID